MTGERVSEISPCPFCGCAGYSQFIDNEFSLGIGMVECGGCGVEMQGIDEADAIAHWNARITTLSGVDPSRIDEFRRLGLCTSNPAPCAAPSAVPSPGATVTIDHSTGAVRVRPHTGAQGRKP